MQSKWSDAEAQGEPVGDEALDSKPPGEGVDGDHHARRHERAESQVQHGHRHGDPIAAPVQVAEFLDSVFAPLLGKIERRLDKPVVNSNQAVLWAALRRLEVTEPIAGLGRLFLEEREKP